MFYRINTMQIQKDIATQTKREQLFIYFLLQYQI